MAQKTYAGVAVDVDAEGFMTNHAQWTREIAGAIAVEEGIVALTPDHWKVLAFMQQEAREKGTAPSIRKLSKAGVISTKELYTIFPGSPAKKAAKIAGLPKPVGCV